MKAVMISIQPKWCELIANGEKTIEVRKTRPKINTPFKCYIYCTYYYGAGDVIFYSNFNNGLIIGEFVCDKIEGLDYLTQIPDLNLQNGRLELTGYTDVEPFYGGKVATIRSTLLSNKELVDYGKGKTLYAWHISDLKIYDKPKEIGAFNHLNKCPNASQNDYDGEWYCDDGYDENAVFNKTKKFPYDEECIYFDCPSCGGENYENEEYAFCMCNGYKPFTRPPQSWQYCEELEDII